MGSSRQRETDLEEELEQAEPEEVENRGPFKIGDIVKVRALRTGYFLHKRRREGDVFRYKITAGDLHVDGPADKKVANTRMLPTWMVEAPRGARLRETGSTEALKREQDGIKALKGSDPAPGNRGPANDDPNPIGGR